MLDWDGLNCHTCDMRETFSYWRFLSFLAPYPLPHLIPLLPPPLPLRHTHPVPAPPPPRARACAPQSTHRPAVTPNNNLPSQLQQIISDVPTRRLLCCSSLAATLLCPNTAAATSDPPAAAAAANAPAWRGLPTAGPRLLPSRRP